MIWYIVGGAIVMIGVINFLAANDSAKDTRADSGFVQKRDK